MIAISLHGKTGEMVATESHPDYMDFAVRSSRTTTSEARVGIADENFVAPIVAALNGKTAIETYPDLTRALSDVTQKYSHREDATTVLPFLIAASRPYPQARWHVVGGERVPRNVRYIEVATMPRVFATSFTSAGERGTRIVDGVLYVRLEGTWRRSTEGVRMDVVDVDPTVDVLKLGRKWDEISGAALLQREIRIRPTGGGTRSKNRKKPPKAGDLPLTGSSGYDETKREVLSVRVDTSAKEALMASGVGRELIEALGLAIASGRTIDDVRAALEETR